jgi:hypothetical protein
MPKAENPSANHISGSFLESGSMLLFESITENATIRYTTDGSEPTELSTIYQEPIILLKSAVVKAAAFKEGMEQSDTETFTYLIEAALLDEEETPQIAIDYVNEQITGFTAEEVYTINGTSYTPEGTSRIIDDTLFGEGLEIMKNGKEGVTTDSEIQNLSIPERPEAPDSIEAVKGHFQGITDAMEYRKMGSDIWIPCEEMSELSDGTYEFRFKAVAGVSFASQIVTVELTTDAPTPSPISSPQVSNSPKPSASVLPSASPVVSNVPPVSEPPKASPVVSSEPPVSEPPKASPGVSNVPSVSEPPKTSPVTPPNKPASLKVKNKKGRKLVVSWGEVAQANGYQVMIAQNKKFTKAKKTKDTAAVKWTFKKLKKKKVYYVRVRAYSISVNQKVYGKWSARKRVKVKK